MDIEERMELIMREPTEEVIKPEELRELLETKEKVVAYNGFEPSGLVHLGTGLICGYKMMDFVKAKVHFKVYLAVWHAYINNKLGGDIEKIRKAAKLFVHSWKSLGVPVEKIEFIRPEEEYDNIEYWNKVIKISKELSLARTKKALQIAGRKEFEANKLASLLYVPMQVADVFHFGVDICQLGMDQRKANVIAREVGPKLFGYKPVLVHNHLLAGLQKPAIYPLPEDPLLRKEALVDVKMSKSKPNSAIFIYDSEEEIRRKIRNAFCPEKDIEYNPILEITRYIVFRELQGKKAFVIEREERFGGNVEYWSYKELEEDFKKGNLHPADLKNAVAEFLIERLKPVREYFEKNEEAKKLLEEVKSYTITR